MILMKIQQFNVIKNNFDKSEIICLKNKYQGFNGAIKTGFENIQSKATLFTLQMITRILI